MSYTTDGLVLRVHGIGENDKLLILLTPLQGRITVAVKGGRSLKCGSLSATQLIAYGNYEINYRSGYKWLRGAHAERQFPSLCSTLDNISLASYFAEVAENLSDENEPAEDILRLTLNSFYALEQQKKPPKQIKAAFELRAAAISGFMPDLDECRGCRKTDSEVMYLDVMNGRLLCADCMHKAALAARRDQARSEDIREAQIQLPITPSVLHAVRYVLHAEPSRFLAFSLTEDELDGFAKVAETYLLSHLGHGFDTLEFYKMLPS